MRKQTCGRCTFYAPIEGSPVPIGDCLVEPPKPFPGVAPTPLVAGRGPVQMNVQGIDPPVRHDRRACRHFLPEIADA
jgi:hypothetical protein